MSTACDGASATSCEVVFPLQDWGRGATPALSLRAMVLHLLHLGSRNTLP